MFSSLKVLAQPYFYYNLNENVFWYKSVMGLSIYFTFHFTSFIPFFIFNQLIRLWKVVYLNIQNFVFCPKFFTLYCFSLFLPTIILYILISFIPFKAFVCLKNCLFVWLLFMYWNMHVRAHNHKETHEKIKIKNTPRLFGKILSILLLFFKKSQLVKTLTEMEILFFFF